MPGKNRGNFRRKATNSISFQTILKSLELNNTMSIAYVTKELGDRRILMTILKSPDKTELGKNIQSRVKRTLKRHKQFVNVRDVVIVEYGEAIFKCDKSHIRQLIKKKMITKNYDNFDPNVISKEVDCSISFISSDEESDIDDDNETKRKNKVHKDRIKDKDKYLTMKSNRTKKFNFDAI
tara:strand:+ start:644 stop:1183 length:540 start_codon:yes stop_codon:yes gene_type:complete